MKRCTPGVEQQKHNVRGANDWVAANCLPHTRHLWSNPLDGNLTAGDSSKCRFVDIIKEQCTHQSIYQDLGALLALVERVDISQLLQQVHYGYGNMWPWLRTDQLIEVAWRSSGNLSANGWQGQDHNRWSLILFLFSKAPGPHPLHSLPNNLVQCEVRICSCWSSWCSAQCY